MTQPPSPPQNSSGEDDGGEELRRLYRQLPTPEPGDALKARLRELTRPSGAGAPIPPGTAASPPPRQRRRWAMPASLAASVLVTVTVGLLVYLQNGSIGPSPERAAPSPAAPTAASAPQGRTSEPAGSPPAPERRAAGGAISSPQAGAAARDFAAPAPAAPLPQAAPSVRAAPNAQADAREEQKQEGASPAPASSLADQAMAKKASPAQPAPGPAEGFADTADGWFAEIQRLDREGDSAAAAALFEKFRQRFPNDPRAAQASWRTP